MTPAELQKLVKIAQGSIPSLEDRPDLETRNNDSEDFYDVAVWGLKAALVSAYMLGKATGKKEAETRHELEAIAERAEREANLHKMKAAMESHEKWKANHPRPKKEAKK